MTPDPGGKLPCGTEKSRRRHVMTFSGDLAAGISLPDVFQNLAGNRASGTLHVKWDKGERFLRIEGGQIAGWSPGAGKDLPLLDHAVERGHVDADALQRATATQRRRKRPARLLLDGKLCDAAGLAAAWRELAAEGVYDLLTLSSAQFSFSAGEPAPGVFDPDLLAANVRLEVGPLLLEGARRADEQIRIRSVVGSEQDLFVADPQAHERAPDETTAAVARLLDGRTDIVGLARATQLGRFAVGAAVLTLVQQGLARPATGEEIAALATDALANHQRDEAIRLLGQALVRMPREALLRHRLAESLAAAGRSREAAGELAMLAFQAAEEEHFAEALAHYERAIQLDPADVLLHQRRCETLQRTGDKQALRDGLMAWAKRLESLGLADRACDVLATHVDGSLLRGDKTLLLRLAELAKANGNHAAAASRFVQVADVHGAHDHALAVRCLRAAVQLQPEDLAIQRRMRDLESGRAEHLRRQRRLLVGMSAAAGLLGCLLYAGAREIQASWQLAAALRERPVDGAGTAALPALRTIAEGHAWTYSGRLAATIAGEEAMRALRSADELRLQGQDRAALAALDAANASLTDAARLRAQALRTQLLHEAPLFAALARVELRGNDDGLARQTLERAASSGDFAFACDFVGRVQCDAARTALLIALAQDAPGTAAAGIVQAWLAARDSAVARLAERALVTALQQDPQAARDSLDTLLRQRREHPEHRAIIERVLELSTSPSALPGK